MNVTWAHGAIRLGGLAAALFITACATGHFDYTPPESQNPEPSNSVVINKPFDQVWSDMIPQIGKSFFVLNNIDKASGILNISYSGDPEEYVDCGVLHSSVSNLAGDRKYDIPMAKPDQTYEELDFSKNIMLRSITQKESLDGRMNVIFEKVSPTETKVTVNTRYVLTRTGDIQPVGGQVDPYSETVTFNTGGEAKFSDSVACRPTGKWEHEILALAN